MKKILLICIIVLGIVFVAGCIGGEKATDTKTSTDSQTNPKSVSETSDFIIKQSDVPGLSLKQGCFYGYSKSSSFNYTYLMGISQYNCYGIAQNTPTTLQIGKKNVGQYSMWEDASGRSLTFVLYEFDTTSDVISIFNSMKKKYDSANIGDYSFYIVGSQTPDIEKGSLQFLKKNHYVTISIKDEKGKGLNEMMRIAKIVEGRLD